MLEDLHRVFKEVFLQRDASMRALWSDRPKCSHNVSQSVKRIRCRSDTMLILVFADHFERNCLFAVVTISGRLPHPLTSEGCVAFKGNMPSYDCAPTQGKGKGEHCHGNMLDFQCPAARPITECFRFQFLRCKHYVTAPEINSPRGSSRQKLRYGNLLNPL